MRRMSALAGLGLVLALVAPASAQESEPAAPGISKAKQILDQTVEALGGEKFLNVTDMTRRGRLYSFNRGELASPGTKFVDYVKFPAKEWLELGDDGKIVYLNNQEQGWELDRQGIREMVPERIEDFLEGTRRDLDYLLRFAYPQGELDLYYLGREFVDNRHAHVIELVDEENRSVKLVIDARNYLPMQVRYREREELSGGWEEVVEYFGKYISIQGVKTPMQFTRERNGRRSIEVHFREVKYNTGVSDEFFTRASLEKHWQDVK